MAVKTPSIKIASLPLWKVAMLAARGKISLEEGTLNWIRKALSAPGISVCPLSSEIAVDSVNLPGTFHGDPADRIIVASARLLNATLVTSDRQILRYAAGEYVKVVRPK